MSNLTSPRVMTVLCATGALVLAVLAAAPQADAATVYVCQKKDGTIHGCHQEDEVQEG
jgi:hypothetical protein